MKRGNTCRGVVLDAGGEPLAGARLRAALRPRLGLTGIVFASAELAVDERGRFEIAGLGRDELWFAVQRAPGAAWLVQGPFDTDDEDVELRLPARSDVALRIASAGTSAALRDIEVVVRRGPPLGELTVPRFAAGSRRALDEACR